MKMFFCVLLSILPLMGFSQERLPIIDMHLHAHPADGQSPPPVAICTPINPFPVRDQAEPYSDTFMNMLKEPPCEDPVWSPMTDDQKRDILYNNAARFLRLSDEEIARHHGL